MTHADRLHHHNDYYGLLQMCWSLKFLLNIYASRKACRRSARKWQNWRIQKARYYKASQIRGLCYASRSNVTDYVENMDGHIKLHYAVQINAYCFQSCTVPIQISSSLSSHFDHSLTSTNNTAVIISSSSYLFQVTRKATKVRRTGHHKTAKRKL